MLIFCIITVIYSVGKWFYDVQIDDARMMCALAPTFFEAEAENIWKMSFFLICEFQTKYSLGYFLG